jgi:hypothetical protein
MSELKTRIVVDPAMNTINETQWGVDTINCWMNE